MLSADHTRDVLIDQVITLHEGDEAFNPATREKVRCYRSRVYFVIENDSPGSSEKLDVTRRVEGLVGHSQLPGIWQLIRAEKFIPVPKDLLCTY